jgi:hypothetical protein
MIKINTLNLLLLSYRQWTNRKANESRKIGKGILGKHMCPVSCTLSHFLRITNSPEIFNAEHQYQISSKYVQWLRNKSDGLTQPSLCPFSCKLWHSPYLQNTVWLVGVGTLINSMVGGLSLRSSWMVTDVKRGSPISQLLPWMWG